MASQVVLQALTEEDLDWVLQVENQNMQTPWTRGGFERALRDGENFLITQQDNTPLGYACLLTIADELHLLTFNIAPEEQSKGYGKQALEQIIQRFENTQFNTILLEVRRSNKIARNLYRSLGFEQDGVRKNYYQTEEGREDALLLSKIIS